MTARREKEIKLMTLIEPEVENLGYELVDLHFAREQVGWVMRIFIDKPGGVELGDCADVSRQLGPFLDVEDPIDVAYNLEVSSPGVERPLRTAAHFQAHLGCEARIVLQHKQNGRKKYKGIITEVSGTEVIVEVDGQPWTIDVADVDRANIVPDWSKILQTSPTSVDAGVN